MKKLLAQRTTLLQVEMLNKCCMCWLVTLTLPVSPISMYKNYRAKTL